MLRVSEDSSSRRRQGSVQSYRQVAASLHSLQIAADQIFDRISERASKEREKLTEISRRIQSAKTKIDAISHSRRALIITSPSRYPSSCIAEDDFPRLFQYKDEKMEDGFLTKLLVNGGLTRELGNDGTMELFQFFSEENIEIPSKPKETQSKDQAHLNAYTFLEDILEEPKFTSSSFLSKNGDAADIALDRTKQRLPPPPPSLLLHNIPSVRRSEEFNPASSVKPLPNTKLPGTISDPKHANKDHNSSIVSDLVVSDD